jgi:hypothetical protein
MFYYLFYFDILEVHRSKMNDNCTEHEIRKVTIAKFEVSAAM